MNKIRIEPIGIVRSSFTPDAGDKWSIVSDLILDEKYSPALAGIDSYSHIIVLFWMDKISEEDGSILQVHPRGQKDLPEVGVFAVRGKTRPNPIGLAVVELLEKKSNVLRVRGLDAFDRTPILDIKPYDHYDVKENIQVPEWWLKMTRRSRKRESK